MNDNIMVSICCITYNHEKYIADAIESFLTQKTNFKFEILIHNDASTDRTAQIIKKYENLYPDIVKPIYQTENQYSKGIKIFPYLYHRAKGKYIALCEGDDYWMYEGKLQAQVDYLEAHSSCTLCVHAAIIVREDKKFIRSMEPHTEDKKCYISDFFRRIDNYPTNSMIFPTKLAQNLPDYYFKASIGDIPSQLFFISKGYAYYINHKWSAYRKGVPHSYTSRKNNLQFALENIKNSKIWIKEFNISTHCKYEDLINQHVRKMDFNFYLKSNNYPKVKDIKFRDLYRNTSKRMKIKVLLMYYFPNITSGLLKIKKEIKSNISKFCRLY